MSLADIAAGVVLAAAALVAVRELVRTVRGGVRKVDDLSALLSMVGELRKIVKQELTHNHGSSMKDDTVGTAVSVHLAHQRLDELWQFLGTFADANALVLPIIHDAIKAQLPEEEEK